MKCVAATNGHYNGSPMESICKNTLAKLEKDIDKLREDRNQYFIKHPQETDKDRNEEICRRAEIIYKEALSSEDTTGMKYLIGGMALNLTDHYDSRCEDCLSMAVRLLPSSTLSWNELGQCISKRGDDPSLVRSIFTSSLSISRSSSTLALLSISIRATLSTLSSDESYLARKESLSLARESVEMDSMCGDGWLSLGNALLAAFFFHRQKNRHHLTESIGAYERAIRSGLDHQSDLHLNLSTALRYECHLKKSLIHLEKAYDCDRSKTILDQLNEYKTILKTMDDSIGEMNASLLYNEENELKTNGIVTGTIVKMCSPPSFTPSLLLLSSSSSLSSPIIVALLNCSSSLSLLMGDIISIPSYQLIQYGSISLLRISCPSSLLRNGRTLRESSLAMASVSIE